MALPFIAGFAMRIMHEHTTTVLDTLYQVFVSHVKTAKRIEQD